MKKQIKAFTLVELIVVIIILAILWTIAFIAMQWYNADARDSLRVSDMWKIKSSLEYYYVDSWKYPDPTALQPVTYSWALAWNQWTFWNSTFINIEKLDKIPKDPLTNREYSYSLLANWQEYELASLIESDSIALTWFNWANADEQTSIAKLTWTYNWMALRVNTDTTLYILALPSITTSIDLNIEENRTLETIIPQKELVIENFRNLPNTYIWSNYDSNKETENENFTLPTNYIVYQWNIDDLTPQELITRLQQTYSWTSISTIENTKELYNINPNDANQFNTLDDFWWYFIDYHLGGSSVVRIYATCDWVAHNTTKTFFTAETVDYWLTCDTVSQDFICIDWVWKNWGEVLNTTTYPYTTCEVSDPLSCNYLWTTINHWDSRDVYQVDTVDALAAQTCDDYKWLVTCNNWTIEGNNNYNYYTCAKWIPLNCDADNNYTVNVTHIYSIPALDHTFTATPNIDIPENNWIYRYTFNAICNNWTIEWNETWPILQSCNTNYTQDWENCIPSVCTFDSWIFDLCVFGS